MAEAKVKTAKEYGDQFCEMMNEDEAILKFVNKKLSGYILDASHELHVAHKANDVEAGSEVVSKARGDIMSLMAFLYGKARKKENNL